MKVVLGLLLGREQSSGTSGDGEEEPEEESPEPERGGESWDCWDLESDIQGYIMWPEETELEEAEGGDWVMAALN